VLKNKITGEITEHDGEGKPIGVFVLVGNLPNTEIFGDEFKKNNSGFFMADEKTLSPIDNNSGEIVEGAFIVGDCREKSLYQVITATADGAIAAVNAEKYTEEKFN
ncbi:MAG: thioredoxin-disulfide reductase, partial [Psychrilyobacter sp.]|nr:thioredoxin-disulfide reductase [Psychrilyobacter sp.]